MPWGLPSTSMATGSMRRLCASRADGERSGDGDSELTLQILCKRSNFQLDMLGCMQYTLSRWLTTPAWRRRRHACPSTFCNSLLPWLRANVVQQVRAKLLAGDGKSGRSAALRNCHPAVSFLDGWKHGQPHSVSCSLRCTKLRWRDSCQGPDVLQCCLSLHERCSPDLVLLSPGCWSYPSWMRRKDSPERRPSRHCTEPRISAQQRCSSSSSSRSPVRC
mmetsp:Transcript_75994/g.138467  ORF Transcript_75994/g.138467 Transcript_75994/m.138467 type:complete len:219 (+) Transcript_75994:195-851(+)